MDKGIIIGAEYEAVVRPTLPLVLFRHSTSVSSLSLFSRRYMS
jgi:hypothetical protein